MALENIDDIIKTIKKSKDREDSKANLIKKFRMTERQAVAILEMRLQALANMERIRVEEELAEKRKLIDELKKILSSRKNIQKVVRTEIDEIQEAYGEERRTQVVPNGVGSFSQEDLIPKEDTVVMITADGYIKRLPPDTFKKQNRGGKGVMGLTTKEEDSVSEIFMTNTHNNILFFTSRGRVFQLKAYEIPPAATRTAKGQAIVNFLQLAPEETLSATLSIDDLTTYKYLVMATKQGVIKKTDLKSFEQVRRSGLIALKIKDGDELKWVQPSTGKDDVMLVTKNGMQIRFDEEGVREMGRTAAGVRGMKLKGEDEIVGMGIVSDANKAVEELFVVMGNGFGKRTKVNEYKQQGRGGSGVKTAKVTEKTGPVIAAIVLKREDMERDVVMISENGQVIRLPMSSVSELGRATQGVRLMRFKNDGDLVASVTLI